MEKNQLETSDDFHFILMTNKLIVEGLIFTWNDMKMK